MRSSRLWWVIFSARLQSRERFAYSVTEAIPALAIALFVIGMRQSGGSALLTGGTVTGFLRASSRAMRAMVQRGDGALGSLSLAASLARMGVTLCLGAVMVAAQAVLAFSIPIDQAFAARFGAGAVATLGYANRIVILVTGFGTVVLARALLPVLSRTIADGDHELGSRHARQWAWLMFGFGAAIALAMWLFADWGVSLVFERGAFSGADTKAVARVLQFGLLQVPLYFGGLVLVQWIAATNRFRYMLIITSCALIVKIAANIVLTPMFKLNEIMISTALMYLVTMILLKRGHEPAIAPARQSDIGSRT